MRYRIVSKPSYSLVEVYLEAGEEILAEAGAMAYMKNVEMETEAVGGIGKALKRKFLGGESFFINKYRCPAGQGIIGLAPYYPGDIELIEVEERIYVQSGSFLACSPAITIDTKWTGAKGFFTGEGLFLLKMEGNGWLFVSSFGGIYEIELENDEIVVDTGHLVAFTEGLEWHVGKAGGLKSFLFGGEGLVAKFRGTGKIWVQTRTIDGFLGWLAARLPKAEFGEETKEKLAAGAFGVLLDAFIKARR